MEKKEKKKKIIDKNKKLQEIQAKIKQCETYSKMDPDPTAKSRVDALVKNPCASRNVLFKCYL